MGFRREACCIDALCEVREMKAQSPEKFMDESADDEGV